MANARESHGVKEEEEAEEEVVLSKLPARHIDALDVKVASLGIFCGIFGKRYLHKLRILALPYRKIPS